MAENSKIEWTHHTFNCWRGCTRVSAGCQFCYAETLSARNPAVLGAWGPKGTRVVASEAQWREPLKWDRAAAGKGERHRVFCASLADVFEDWRGPMVDADGNRLHAAAGLVSGRTRSDYWYSESPCDEDPAPFVRMEYVRARLFKLIHLTPNLDWLLLTKRASFLREAIHKTADYATNNSVPQGIRDGAELACQWLLGSPMPNVWLGVSVENQAAADERIPHLLATPAAVRFLSVEPLLGEVDLDDWLDPVVCDVCGPLRKRDTIRIERRDGERYCRDCHRDDPEAVSSITGFEPELDWCIVGGESGPGARPMQLEWARFIVRQCQAAGVPVFVKQLGSTPLTNLGVDDGHPAYWPVTDKKGGDIAEFPADLRIREFPAVTPH